VLFSTGLSRSTVVLNNAPLREGRVRSRGSACPKAAAGRLPYQTDRSYIVPS